MSVAEFLYVTYSCTSSVLNPRHERIKKRDVCFLSEAHYSLCLKSDLPLPNYIHSGHLHLDQKTLLIGE